MTRVKVKICGITREQDLRMVTDFGADAVGFVVGVPSSPRNVPLNKAKRLIELVPLFVKSVLVTVPTDTNQLVDTYEKLNPDALQIHGDKISGLSTLRMKLKKVSLIRAVAANPINALEIASEVSKAFDAILFDSYTPGRYGGTGTVHDWELSKRVNQTISPKPMILAGGLTPENIKDCISRVQPYAVDVSTGVELRPGLKDSEKVSAFIQNAKEVQFGVCD